MPGNLIAVRGRASVGKTSTIIEVRQQLLKQEGIAEIDHVKTGNRAGDFWAVLQGKHRRIGIASEGDREDLLSDHLDRMIEAGCDVIVCATRTRGATVSCIEGLRNRFAIEWIEKSPSNPDTTTQRESDNRGTAKAIARRVAALLEAADRN